VSSVRFVSRGRSIRCGYIYLSTYLLTASGIDFEICPVCQLRPTCMVETYADRKIADSFLNMVEWGCPPFRRLVGSRMTIFKQFYYLKVSFFARDLGDNYHLSDL